VQFTRNPAGLSGALQKIGGLSYGSKLAAAHADEASHMFFSNGVGRSLFGLMDTHPPLEERIRAIDPAFNGKFPRVSVADGGAGLPAGQDAPQLDPAGSGGASLAGLAPPVIASQSVLPNLDNATTAHLHFAAALRASFPPAIQNAARDPLGASSLIYGMLLSLEPEQRNKQLQLLSQAASDDIRRETERLLPDVESIAANAKLPLVDLALPALRHFSPAQYRQFSRAIQTLIESDGKIDLHEYVLQKIVLRHLDPQFNGARKPVIQYYAIRPLVPDCAVLLSALAHAGADDAARAEAAFLQGARQLGCNAGAELAFLHSDQCDLPQVDAALNRLCQAAPQIKKSLLGACALTVAANGVIQETEAELLRAIADTLDCPMPPFLQSDEEPAAAGV
jgi:hypothetical protein